VRLASPIGSAAGGSVNLSTSLSNVAKLAAHPKFVWVFNANCDGTIIYNDPVYGTRKMKPRLISTRVMHCHYSVNFCTKSKIVFVEKHQDVEDVEPRNICKGVNEIFSLVHLIIFNKIMSK
jgi:hypothetical protein